MALYERNEQENRENRKKRRQKEQLQAFALLAGALAALVLVVVLVTVAVKAILRSNAGNQNQTVKENTQVSEEVTEDEFQPDEEAIADPSEEVADSEADIPDEAVEDDTPEEEVVPAEPTEEDKQMMLDSYVDNILSTMTLEEKVASMFLVTPQNITGVAAAKQAGSTTSAAMNTYAVGGILYDENNMEDKDQFALMVANTRGFSKLELFIAVSDEGGETSPFSISGIREEVLPGQAEIAEEGAASAAYSAGINKSSLFRSLGINLNLAPVADVASNPSSAIASRSYGSDVKTVSSLVKSEVKGMADQGVDSCVKYFPGQGDVKGDTRTARVTSQRDKAALESEEYVIYKDLIAEGVPMIMVSHVSMPNVIGDNTPASLSGVIITDILRGELGFDGVIITDYMNKAAITKYYKHAVAPVMAVQAGADMIAVPADFKRAYQGLLSAVQTDDISEERINESVRRILRMKYKNLVDYGSEVGNEE